MTEEFLFASHARARCVSLLYVLRITKIPRLVNRLCLELPYSPFAVKVRFFTVLL